MAIPDKPLMVLATDSRHILGPRWYMEFGANRWIDTRTLNRLPTRSINVIPHPDNDPEAVQIIELARRAKEPQ